MVSVIATWMDTRWDRCKCLTESRDSVFLASNGRNRLVILLLCQIFSLQSQSSTSFLPYSPIPGTDNIRQFLLYSVSPDVNIPYKHGAFVKTKVDTSILLSTKFLTLLGFHQFFHSCPFPIPEFNLGYYIAFSGASICDFLNFKPTVLTIEIT